MIEKFEPGDKLRFMFFIPMPKTWPKKKKDAMYLQPHQQKPDIDNYCKALMDSMFQFKGGDHAVHEIHATKCWADEGYIEVRNL